MKGQGQIPMLIRTIPFVMALAFFSMNFSLLLPDNSQFSLDKTFELFEKGENEKKESKEERSLSKEDKILDSDHFGYRSIQDCSRQTFSFCPSDYQNPLITLTTPPPEQA